MKTKISLSFLLLAIANFNEINQFLKTANELGGKMNWINTIDAIGTIAIPIMLLYFIWEILKIKQFYKNELIDYKDYKSYKVTASLITNHREQLLKNLELNTVINTTTTRALVQYILNMSESEQKRLANIFYNENINIKDLEKIGIKGELINSMKIRYYDEQKSKIK